MRAANEPSAAAVKVKIQDLRRAAARLVELVENWRGNDEGEAAKVLISAELRRARASKFNDAVQSVMDLEIATAQAAQNMGETRGIEPKSGHRRFVRQIAEVVEAEGGEVVNPSGAIASSFIDLVIVLRKIIGQAWPRYVNVAGRFDFPRERGAISTLIRRTLNEA